MLLIINGIYNLYVKLYNLRRPVGNQTMPATSWDWALTTKKPSRGSNLFDARNINVTYLTEIPA